MFSLDERAHTMNNKHETGDKLAKPILCDFWYIREIGEIAIPLDSASSKAIPRRIRARIIAALNLFNRARKYATVVPHWYDYGPLYVILAGLRGDRNVVLLEFIDIKLNDAPRPVRTVYRLFARYVLAPAMRRSVRTVQVLTEREAEMFVDLYGYPRERVAVVRWPLSGVGTVDEKPTEKEVLVEGAFVFSSGRAACDWSTLFVAAEGASWPLVIVCSSRDRPSVDALNKGGRAMVLSEISLSEHNRLLGIATVYALVLNELEKSSGQVRLATCIGQNVPVIASAVAGLDGYLIDKVTAIAVPVGDATSLRAALNCLMDSPTARASLVESARNYASSYSWDDYFCEIRRLLLLECK
jgi:hypothetical protein